MRTWPIVVLKYAAILAYIGACIWASNASGTVQVDAVTLRFGLVALITLLVAAWHIGRIGYHGWVRVAAGISVFVAFGVVVAFMAGLTGALHIAPEHLKYWGWATAAILVIAIPLAGWAVRSAGVRLWWAAHRRSAFRPDRLEHGGD